MKISPFIFTILLSLILWACNENEKRTKTKLRDNNKVAKAITSQLVKHLFFEKDSICIVTDTKLIKLPRLEIYNGQIPTNSIYLISNNKITKKYNFLTDKYLYFSTFDTVVSKYSQLYVFDLKNKVLVQDKEFKRSCLVCLSEKFILDTLQNKIFPIDIGFYNKKNSEIVYSGMYNIVKNDFHFFKAVYEKNTNIISDNSGEDDNEIIGFYNRSLNNNAAKGKLLPRDWWKW